MFFRPLSTRYTEFQSFFGEFVATDNGISPNQENGKGVILQSCDHQNIQRVDHPNCAGIQIPPDDVIHKTFPDEKCMPFARTIPCARCRLGPRMISNVVTAAHDLNSVYGVSTEMSNARRTMVGGRLQSQMIMGEETFAVDRYNNSGRYRCFEGKCENSPIDGRNAQFITGHVLALLFHRNHNRHARKLEKILPKWTDEQIFQEARRWNIAEYQHCLCNEYLKTLIGFGLSQKFGILPRPLGQFTTYKRDMALRTIIEFQSTAGRIGHASLSEEVNMEDPKTGKKSKINIRYAAQTESIFYEGRVDEMFVAQMSRPAFEITPSIPFKTFLLDLPGRTFGIDLGSFDIQRQRDHGIPGYIHYIKYCHNVDVRSWNDLRRFIDTQNIEKLKKYYKNVEDVDLYVGGHYERKVENALVGPTFGTIIGIQFHNIKYGDRFFYEHGNQVGSFKVHQLNEIKMKTSFASFLCKNTKLKKVLFDPLRLESATNPFVKCSEFHDIDYKLGWNHHH